MNDSIISENQKREQLMFMKPSIFPFYSIVASWRTFWSCSAMQTTLQTFCDTFTSNNYSMECQEFPSVINVQKWVRALKLLHFCGRCRPATTDLQKHDKQVLVECAWARFSPGASFLTSKALCAKLVPGIKIIFLHYFSSFWTTLAIFLKIKDGLKDSSRKSTFVCANRRLYKSDSVQWL